MKSSYGWSDWMAIGFGWLVLMPAGIAFILYFLGPWVFSSMVVMVVLCLMFVFYNESRKGNLPPPMVLLQGCWTQLKENRCRSSED